MKRNNTLVFVMGRNYASRLGMIRAAGMVGCDVVVVRTNKAKRMIYTVDTMSKYVVAVETALEPNSQELLEVLEKYKNDKRIKILLPTDDYTASVIDFHLDDLKSHYLMGNIDNKQGAIINCMDKNFQKKIALKKGLNVSKGWICYFEEKYIIPEGIIYPCFTKPLDSYKGHLKKYMKKCDNEKQLTEVLESIALIYKRPIFIEEYHKIEKEYAILGLSLKNKTVIPSIIQMESCLDGVAASGYIYPIKEIPQLRNQLSAFMEEFGFVGLFDIDMYESEGKLYFNELNLRFGASGFALTYSLINLPGLLIQYLLEGCADTTNVISDFKKKRFVNEKVLRDLYADRDISFREYRLSVKQSDIRAIALKNDMRPSIVFSIFHYLSPVVRFLKQKIKR